jgi:hypothetical protein
MESAELQIDWEPTATTILREVDGWRLVDSPPLDRWAISEGHDLFGEIEAEIRARAEREAKGEGGWIHDWLMSMVPTSDGVPIDYEDTRALVSPDGAQWRCWRERPGDDSPGWMDETHWDRENVDETIGAQALHERVPEGLRGFVVVQTRAATMRGMYDLPSANGVERALSLWPQGSTLWGSPFNRVIEIGLALDWLRGEPYLRRPFVPGTFRREGPEVHFCGERPSVLLPEDRDSDWWNFTLGPLPFACGGRLSWFESHVTIGEDSNGRETRRVKHGWRCDWCERVSYGPQPDELDGNYSHGSCAPARREEA